MQLFGTQQSVWYSTEHNLLVKHIKHLPETIGFLRCAPLESNLEIALVQPRLLLHYVLEGGNDGIKATHLNPICSTAFKVTVT